MPARNDMACVAAISLKRVKKPAPPVLMFGIERPANRQIAPHRSDIIWQCSDRAALRDLPGPSNSTNATYSAAISSVRCLPLSECGLWTE